MHLLRPTFLLIALLAVAYGQFWGYYPYGYYGSGGFGGGGMPGWGYGPYYNGFGMNP